MTVALFLCALAMDEKFIRRIEDVSDSRRKSIRRSFKVKGLQKCSPFSFLSGGGLGPLKFKMLKTDLGKWFNPHSLVDMKLSNLNCLIVL